MCIFVMLIFNCIVSLFSRPKKMLILFLIPLFSLSGLTLSACGMTRVLSPAGRSNEKCSHFLEGAYGARSKMCSGVADA